MIFVGGPVFWILAVTAAASVVIYFERMIELFRRFKRRVKLGFGLGTNLTNDLGPAPLNIVIKMTKANGQPVAKISDTPNKGMCEDLGYLAYLRQVFGIPNP